MADKKYLSKITLPGTGAVADRTYELKDAEARSLIDGIAGGLKFVVCYDGSAAPVVANIPAGVDVYYNNQKYTGTKSAETAEPFTFYLVLEKNDVYAEYVAIGETGSKAWEKLGDTSLDLSDLGALAYKDSVDLTTGSAYALTSASASASTSSVSFAAHTSGSAMGSNATFNASVTPSTTHIKATAAGAAVDAADDTFVKSYPGSSSKLVKDSVNGVSSNTEVTASLVSDYGAASSWSFAMGTGSDAETLVISGGNGTAASGSAVTASKVATASKSFATGAVASDGAGDSVLIGLGTATTASALTAVSVSAQPSITISTGSTGDVSVATGISTASVSIADAKAVQAITALGAATAAAPSVSLSLGSGSFVNSASVSVS